tara:strand:- start:854 stop:1303 length:450 start_codon:yes stop_codon:yes gene_type:complete
MSSNNFRLIALEIPKSISFEDIEIMRDSVSSIDFEKARIINNFIKLNLEDIDISDELTEEDLFHIGEDALKEKKAVRDFLYESIDAILLPRIMAESRFGTDINQDGFAYLELEGKVYAVSGDQVAYYSSVKNKAYNYLLSLNISGIINI